MNSTDALKMVQLRPPNLRQFGRDDAPDQPHRKSDVLGNDRPDEVATGDDFALRIPELLILGIPF
jgi:hypothetical protein